MEHSLRTELTEHLIATIQDADLHDFEELHFHAFNEDYYIVGYYQGEQWLAKHDISPFDAIAEIIEWETDTLGEVTLNASDINGEKIANLYVYLKGEELLQEFDLDQDQESLIYDLKSSLQ